MFNFKKQSGFTIIETLVAITILMISLAGPLTVAHRGLLAAVSAHDTVTASFLAQDAMEYVKNVRDNNRIQGRDWLAGLTSCTRDDISSTNQCSVDTLYGDPTTINGSIEISPCSDTTCVLYLRNTSCFTNLCGYGLQANGGTKTQFSRYFYIIPRSGNVGDEAQVVVIVTWNNGLVSNQVAYESELFDITK